MESKNIPVLTPCRVSRVKKQATSIQKPRWTLGRQHVLPLPFADSKMISMNDSDLTLAANQSMNETTDLDCYSLETTPDGAQILYTIVLGCIVAVSLLGNGLVLLLVSRYKQLRSRSVMVSLSVVAADILLTITYTLPILVTAALHRWPFGYGGCVVFGGTSFQFLMTRWLIMALLCVDRFSTVRFPFSYRRYSKRILIVLTVLAWAIPFLFSLPTFSNSGFGPVQLRENLPTCFITCGEEGRACQLFYLFYFTTVFFLGSAVPIGLYSWMYYHARKLRPTMLALGHVTTQVASGAIVRTPVAQYQLPSREKRAFVTFALIMFTVLITGVPAYILQLVRVASLTAHCRIPIYVHYIITSFLLSASALDPFVIMRTKDFRTCIKLLFCRRMAHTEDITSRDGHPEQLDHLTLSKSASNESQQSALSDVQDVDSKTVHTELPNGNPPSHLTLDQSPRTSVS